MLGLLRAVAKRKAANAEPKAVSTEIQTIRRHGTKNAKNAIAFRR
jgi:hypothetical protein